MICKSHPLFGQLVNPRCQNIGGAITTQVLVSLIVIKNDDDVWEFQNWHNESKINQEFLMTDKGLKPVAEVEGLDNIDGKIDDRLNELDKMEKLEKLHKLDSLIEMEKNKQKIDNLCVHADNYYKHLYQI